MSPNCRHETSESTIVAIAFNVSGVVMRDAQAAEKNILPPRPHVTEKAENKADYTSRFADMKLNPCSREIRFAAIRPDS